MADATYRRKRFSGHPGRAVLLMLLLLAMPLMAAEVDQFTLPPGEPVELPDSAVTLEREVNRLLKQSVRDANNRIMIAHAKSGTRWQQPRCDEARLYGALTGALAGSVIGELETYAEESPRIVRRRVPLQQSIYRDFYWQASPTLVWSERMAAVIRVNDIEIGTDKLGHFFSEGYSYFMLTGNLTRDVEHGLLFGEWSESVYFGAQTTGVYSFADLAANFQGLRFWNRILARQADPLTGQIPEPYIICKRERWKVVQAFQWQDYVDVAWHEGINCPALRNADLLERVQRNGAQCHPGQLQGTDYGRWQKRVLNPAGLMVLPEQLQAEVILKKRVDRNDVELSKETLDYIGELRLRLEAWRSQAQALHR